MISLTWHSLALVLLICAIGFHLLAAFGVRTTTNWPEWAWAAFTAAAFCLLL